MRSPAESPVARKWMAAIAALALVGAVLTPALAASAPASAADPSFVGVSDPADAVWEDKTLAPMYVGIPYSDTIVRTDGLTYWYGLSGLPAGLTYSTSDKTLTIFGTPTTAGPATVRVNNSDQADGNGAWLEIAVTVLPTPMTTVRANLSAPAAVTPGSTINYSISVTNTGTVPALNASFAVPEPVGATVSSFGWTTADWNCTFTGSRAVSCVYLRPLEAGATTSSSVTITDYAKSPATVPFVSATPTAKANNATESAAPAAITRMNLSTVFLIAPTSTPYSSLTVTAYAPNLATSGYMSFSVQSNGHTYELGNVAVSSTGAATLVASPALVAPAVGPNASIIATYYPNDDGAVTAARKDGVDVFRQTTFAGHFFLNGLPFTNEVDVTLVSAASPSSIGSTATVSSGDYTSAELGGVSASESYVLWARLGPEGAPITYLTASGTPNATLGQASVFNRYTFNDDMDFYWELPAMFRDSTMDVPRAGELFADGVKADSNVDVSYDLASGELPTGLELDGDTGEITGTATNPDEAYDFVIEADNGFGTVQTGHITGTVLPAYAAPLFVDSELGHFRVGESFVDEVTASGEPIPTFRVLNGALPTGITLDSDGSVYGTPTTAGAYAFTIVAESTKGFDTRIFSGTVAPAWVAPHWTDDEVAVQRAGVALTDGVHADGDGTIVYSVTHGSFPGWLTLDSVTGALTGTPSASDAGEAYSFEVTAESEHGSVSVWLMGTVGEAPLVALDPSFAVGDPAAGATGRFWIEGAGDGVDFDVTVHSTPVKIVVGTTSTAGAASGTFTLPAGLGTGAHSLVLTTTAADGTPRTFTVWFTIKGDGTIGAISYVGPITFLELVTTGTDPWIAGSIAAALLALGGVFLIRRRKAA